MRLAPILLLAATTLTAQHYDLLLKGGHVIDPKNRVDSVRDVAITGGRVARVAESIDASQSRQVVDVSGLYVTPGLLDIHVHIYPRLPQTLAPGRNLGVDPDAFSRMMDRLGKGEAGEAVFDDRFVAQYAVAGTASQCFERFQAYRDVGVTELGVWFAADRAIESIERLGRMLPPVC